MQLLTSINKDKNGIKVRFDAPPTDEITTLLSKLGFKSSYKQTMWYATQTDQRNDFIKLLTEALETVLELNIIELYPAYEPSLENIDNRNYSYVLVSYQNEEDSMTQAGYIIFEPCKRIAEEIVRRNATATFGGQLKKIAVFPRNYKKKARSMFEEGKVIYSSIPEQHEQLIATKKLEEETLIDQLTTQVVDLADVPSISLDDRSKAEEDVSPHPEESTTSELYVHEEEEKAQLPHELIGQDKETAQKEKSDEDILDELFRMNQVNQLGRSLLKDLGLKTPLNTWEIRIGSYRLIRTSVFSFTYRLTKLTT